MVEVQKRKRSMEQNEAEALLKRAKLRALHLLEIMDRTEEQLRIKLKRDAYPDDIIETAIQYVKSFGYIGDASYAKRYIENKKNSKSKLEIKMALLQKGVSQEVVQNALEECYDAQDESVAIQRILEKKRFSKETATDLDKKKMCEYLLRKGFHYEDIRQVIQVSYQNA